MYIYQIEIYEHYNPSDTYEMVQSEFEYNKEEFQNIINSIKNQVIREKGHMDYSYFWELCNNSGFNTFEFTAQAYIVQRID